jgi:hypothetical protein
MAFTVEYDDGKPANWGGDTVRQCVPRGRVRGMFVRFDDGTELRIPISFMKVGEMKPFEEFLKEVCGCGGMADAAGREPAAREGVGVQVPPTAPSLRK